MDKKSDPSGVDKQESDVKDSKLEGLPTAPLPTETSPYTQYKDLEDYKKQGYGTEGHIEPEAGRGAASSTDAPTLSSDSATSKDQLSTASDTINQHGVP